MEQIKRQMAETTAGELASFDRVIRMRIALAIGLLAPLAFFLFLVIRFQEAWLLAGVAVGVYLYILAQFFVWQNPRRNALLRHRPEAGGAGGAERRP